MPALKKWNILIFFIYLFFTNLSLCRRLNFLGFPITTLVKCFAKSQAAWLAECHFAEGAWVLRLSKCIFIFYFFGLSAKRAAICWSLAHPSVFWTQSCGCIALWDYYISQKCHLTLIHLRDRDGEDAQKGIYVVVGWQPVGESTPIKTETLHWSRRSRVHRNSQKT